MHAVVILYTNRQKQLVTISNIISIFFRNHFFSNDEAHIVRKENICKHTVPNITFVYIIQE